MKCGVILKITLLVLISASFSDQQKWTNALNVIPTNNVRVFKRNAVPISSSTTTKSMTMPEIRITENKQIESPKLKKRKKSDDRKNDRVMNLKETPKTTAKYEVTLSDEMLTVPSDKPEMYKSRSNIEIIPKEEKHKEKTAIKRNPKDIGRKIEEVESESVTEDSDVGHGKPNLLKGLKRTRPGNSETVLGEAKPVKQLKPLILPRKQMTIINSCASPAIKMQIEIVKDRLFKLIERMDKTAVNCASLNNEIETIRTLLQQAMHKTPEGRHRDVDRSKILDQLRERQAKIHARFGRLELIKPKHSLVGDVKVESETQIKEKDQEQAT